MSTPRNASQGGKQQSQDHGTSTGQMGDGTNKSTGAGTGKDQTKRHTSGGK